MSVHKDAVKVKELLDTLYDKNILEQVFQDFSSRALVFARLYACSNTYESLFDFYERLYKKMVDSHVWTQHLHQILGG